MPATHLFYGFKRKRCIYYSFTRSDQPGCGTITRKGENKHLLLNASRLQCDMFAVLSSSDVWPIVIHFKRLACVARSLSCTNPHLLSFSIFIGLSVAARLIPSSPWLLHSSLQYLQTGLLPPSPASISTLLFLSPLWLSSAMFMPLPFSLHRLCIGIFKLECFVMMQSDQSCWMILTWYPT